MKKVIDILDDEDGEIIEITTELEFNLRFTKVANSSCKANFPRKVSRSVKKIKDKKRRYE